MKKGLCEICSPKQWKTISTDMLTDSGYPVYGANGIIGYYSKYNHVEKTILVTCRGATCGALNICEPYSYVNGNAMALDNLADEIDISYLFYFLQNRGFSDTITGSAQPQIVRQSLEKIQIIYPDKQTQKRIVIVLDKVSGLIYLRKQQLTKLDELVRARFVEMFGDCKTNPKRWNTVALSDISEVGSSKRVFVEELKKEGIPFYRGTEVGALAEGKQISPELFITNEHYQALCEASGKPCIGDLLMPSICPDGRIWIVDTEKPFYFKDGRVLWVHLQSKNYDSTFLQYTLKDRIITDYSSIASGTTFAELKIFALKSCQIFDVPKESQNQFAAFVEQINKQKLTIQQSLDKLETLKKALMQEYFE